MIIGDARDDREYRSDHIGRIESPSHTYLDHCILTSLITKIEKCQQCTPLIIRESMSIDDDPLCIDDKICLRDQPIIRLKSLTDIDEMRTRIDSYLFS